MEFLKDKHVNVLCYVALALLYIAGAVQFCLFLTGCTVSIESYGENAKFELSPARNIYPNTSVMNGLSLIPSGGSDESEKDDDEEKPANAKASNTDNK